MIMEKTYQLLINNKQLINNKYNNKKMNKQKDLKETILNTIGDLLTDICEESTQGKDTNDRKNTYTKIQL